MYKKATLNMKVSEICYAHSSIDLDFSY